MNFEELIREISKDFNKAWNQWDIEKMMSFFTEDVVISSPKISAIYPDNTENKIIGKQRIKEYWIQLEKQFGAFTVTQMSFEKKDRHIHTMNKINESGVIIAETFTLNEYGKINELHYKYLDKL